MLGFPTANMFLQQPQIDALQLMENGVFYGWGVVEPKLDDVIPVVLSVGHNPHFNDKALTVEVHFVRKFDADFYGATMRILVLGKLRDQKKYDGLEALIADIQRDVDGGVELLAAPKATAFKQAEVMTRAMKSVDVPLLVQDVPSPAVSSAL